MSLQGSRASADTLVGSALSLKAVSETMSGEGSSWRLGSTVDLTNISRANLV